MTSSPAGFEKPIARRHHRFVFPATHKDFIRLSAFPAYRRDQGRKDLYQRQRMDDERIKIYYITAALWRPGYTITVPTVNILFSDNSGSSHEAGIGDSWMKKCAQRNLSSGRLPIRLIK